jgi:hypothetical protein
MTREEQVKAVGVKAGARVVGIAAVEAFRAKVPEGYRPEDILPGARSAHLEPPASRPHEDTADAAGLVPTPGYGRHR